MQKVFGLCAAQHVTQIDESIHTGEMDTKEYGNMLKPILTPEGKRVPAKNARG